MKTKQIPDDFRDWIEARTFEIAAPTALSLCLPLDYFEVDHYSPNRNKCSDLRKSPLKPMLSATWKLEITHRSICFLDFPAVSHARRYALRV
jgi:hypothetical protein